MQPQPGDVGRIGAGDFHAPPARVAQHGADLGPGAVRVEFAIEIGEDEGVAFDVLVLDGVVENVADRLEIAVVGRIDVVVVAVVDGAAGEALQCVREIANTPQAVTIAVAISTRKRLPIDQRMRFSITCGARPV